LRRNRLTSGKPREVAARGLCLIATNPYSSAPVPKDVTAARNPIPRPRRTPASGAVDRPTDCGPRKTRIGSGLSFGQASLQPGLSRHLGCSRPPSSAANQNRVIRRNQPALSLSRLWPVRGFRPRFRPESAVNSKPSVVSAYRRSSPAAHDLDHLPATVSIRKQDSAIRAGIRTPLRFH